MDGQILRKMIAVSNNCPLTQKAAAILSTLTLADRTELIRWLDVAERERNIEVNAAKKKSRIGIH